jgi:integrase
MASILKLGPGWRALIRRKGHKSICKTLPTKAAAEAWARIVEAGLDAGKSVAAIQGVRVGELIEVYRGLREKVRPILDTSNEHYMLLHLAEGLGDMAAEALTIDDLIAWCAQRAEEGAGPYTLNMEVSKLGTVLRYAAAAKRLTLPDVIGQARPLLSHTGLIGGGNLRTRRVTEDELVRLLEAVSPWMADVVVFAVATAMRREEIVRIAWADLDAKKKLVVIRDRKHPRKKRGNDEWVPLLGVAWEVVQAQPRREERIFPRHPQTISKAFKAACDKLGIADLHFHDLRHEGTSRLFESG